MAEDKELQEIRKEVVEARNLVIKADNQLKSLHAAIKQLGEKQRSFERRSLATSATAFILFASLSSLGAFMFARSEIRVTSEQLVEARTARAASDVALADARAREQEVAEESARALKLFERLSSDEEKVRVAALEEVIALEPQHLSALERRALEDKAYSLRQAIADAAFESGRTAFYRKDYTTAARELNRHLTVAVKPDPFAPFLLGQSFHAQRDFSSAVEPLENFLREMPTAKSADYAMLILGESYAETGQKEKAIETYTAGAARFPSSQFASWMRTRVKRLEQ